MAAILVTRKLGRRFGGLQAVAELDLEVEEGAIHSIIGPNGAGKTTVFNLITQALAPSSGKVLMRGLELNGLTQDRVAAAGISRTYQNIRLFRNITALDNLLVGMHLHLTTSWWQAILNGGRRGRPSSEPGRRRKSCSSSSACGGAATCSPGTSPTASKDVWR